MLTAVLAGLAGELWKPLFDVVTAIMVILGVLAAIGSLLPDRDRVGGRPAPGARAEAGGRPSLR